MFYMLKISSNLLFLLSGIYVKNINRKKIDFSKTYVVIPTHKSYIEAATIYTSMPVRFKSLGKKELEKTPIYGYIFKAVCIAVDRSSVTARALSFRKMNYELSHGNSIVIFPEGTFKNIPNNKLLPFQDGCFTLAITQQTDLLPILFPDSVNRMHPVSFTQMSPGINRAIFLPPISVKGLQKKDVSSLNNYTFNYMQYCIDYFFENKKNNVYEFALSYQKNNPILPS